MIRRLLHRLCVAVFVLATAAEAAAQGGKPAITMREKVYEKLSRAQEAAELKDYARAFKLLDDVEKMRDLDPYEKAQLYTALGYIYFMQEKYAESVVAYEKVLSQENLPDVVAETTLYTLAQLQFQLAEYESASGYLERWLARAASPAPEAYVLLGQAYYQLGRYRDAIAPVERAIDTARQRQQPIKENWYVLLRALYHELKDYPKLLEVLEILVTQFPNKEYWVHLAAAYGETGDDARQLAAYEVAHEQGYLDGGRELLLLSQLLLQAQVPYRAGVILSRGLESGAVEGTATNYRLLSQAWILARENTKSIAALKKAAALSDDGEVDARLAQSYANLDDWEQSIQAARAALRKGVRDAHELHITIGMALFELGRYADAKDAFREAQTSSESRATATKWITYIESEEKRLRELQASLE